MRCPVTRPPQGAFVKEPNVSFALGGGGLLAVEEGMSEKVPPGEGERRAQRGYVPQYDMGARLIYKELASGRLRWIGRSERSDL